MQRTILDLSSFTMKTIVYVDDSASLDTNKIYLLLFVNISRPQGGSTLLTGSLTPRICEIIMLMY